jgi:hypothetical protein
MKNLKQRLKEVLIHDDKLHIDILYSSVLNWPIADYGETIIHVDYDIEGIEDDEMDGFNEPQNLEKWSVTDLSDDKMVIYCGAYWQNSMKITLELVDGEIKAIDNVLADYQEGMSTDEFIKQLKSVA